MEELGAVLGLLTQFTHHVDQPNLEHVAKGTLVDLAEAVEKYDVYSAKSVCKIMMKQVYSVPL